MSDNITIKDGDNADTVVGADDIGGIKYIRHKLVWGADGTVNDASASNPLPITPIATEFHLGEVGGNGSLISVSFTRPADTTAYSIRDSVSTSSPSVLTFTNIARINQGTGYIVKAKLVTDQVTNTAKFRLHLFHTSPAAISDNSQFTILWANKDKSIGYIDFDALSTEGTGSDCAYSVNSSLRLHYACDSGSRTLYGMLEAIDPFTPASGQNFYIELGTENN